MSNEKKKWGDRFDGVWVKDVDSLHAIMPHIYNRRTQCEVYMIKEFDITELIKYIEKQNKKHPQFKTTVFHAILLGVGKIIYHRPLLNRFIMARRTYQRKWIELSFVVKKEFNDKAEETMMNLRIEPEMTLDSLSEKIDAFVKKARVDSQNSTEDTMALLANLPRPVLTFIVWLIKVLDKWGKLPRFIWEGDINYSTMILTNLGSIKSPAVYHHLNEYGTASMVAAIGTIKKQPLFDEQGQVKEIRDVVEVGVTVDERIADGFYFARSLDIMDKMLKNPALFNKRIDEALDE